MLPFKYLFGPVPSRRLGRSLGIDLVLPKTCTESCVFCQVGRTDSLCIERREYVPTDEVIREFHAWCQGGTTDVVTLSGSGEPTLHSRFGDILQAVRSASPYRTVLLSNGTLFWMPDVRAQACRAHTVKASLSAWDQASFERINRPHPDLRFDRIVEGLRSFRADFQGEMWLEVFVVKGMNDQIEDMRRIAALTESIAPDRVHLNTVVRPPCELSAQPVTRASLDAFAAEFGPNATVIANVQDSQEGTGDSESAVDEAMVLNILERRGCRLKDLALGLGVGLREVSPAVEKLFAEKRVHTEDRNGETYYSAVATS